MTVEQAADIECLRLGRTLDAFAREEGRATTSDLTRAYLIRLQRSDPARDWNASAPPFSSTMLYGDFMAKMNMCMPPPLSTPSKSR